MQDLNSHILAVARFMACHLCHSHISRASIPTPYSLSRFFPDPVVCRRCNDRESSEFVEKCDFIHFPELCLNWTHQHLHRESNPGYARAAYSCKATIAVGSRSREPLFSNQINFHRFYFNAVHFSGLSHTIWEVSMQFRRSMKIKATEKILVLRDRKVVHKCLKVQLIRKPGCPSLPVASESLHGAFESTFLKGSKAGHILEALSWVVNAIYGDKEEEKKEIRRYG
ncbi:unnamed protein product [Protopolystoma xenopodis]|uniref:Uncharacterized protein n=1 Tax=Protopolystoma xenopodis TaxID=117903 RepID=A0A3S5ADV2_9PLAT|nr:unnamed protein product [Protopolystoma xenopodis]